ncbi:Uncharacterised protein [Mycobacteroides abscessus subsp. abscessus]|nr:Uncharacterised protein [Mycobacteroides abscessus subsp. abscessus]
MRSSPTGVTPNGFSSGSVDQCEVARCPSSRPAAASTSEPLHTDVVQAAAGCTRRNQSSSFSSRAAIVVPGPPGTSTTSGSGVSPKEWVAPMTSTPESAVTGPGSCHTNRTSVSGMKRNTSYGPMKSSAVKSGYNTIAICVAGEVIRNSCRFVGKFCGIDRAIRPSAERSCGARIPPTRSRSGRR